MIRLPHFLAALLIAASAITAYPQEGLPVELLQKLNAKAVELYPEDLRAQESYVRTNEDAYRLIQVLPATPGNEALLQAIKKRADEKFPLEYLKQSEYIQDMNDGLMLIDAYAFAFPDKKDFEKMKAEMLKAYPDDYKKAASVFEKQSLAVVEIGSIPKPESLDQETWDAIKLGFSAKYKDDFSKQKDGLMKFSERMTALYVYEESEKYTAQNTSIEPSKYEMMEEIKKYLSDAVLLIQNNAAIGYVTSIRERDAILFPAEAFEARGISVTNKLDESLSYGDVYASKDVPVMIAFVNSKPEGLKSIHLADEAHIRESVNQDCLVYSFEMRADMMNSNKISAMGAKNLNMSNRIMRTMIPGALVIDEDGDSAMGMVLNQTRLADIGNIANQSDAKELVKKLKKENLEKVVVRLDKLQNWEKIDPQQYLQQAETVENLRKRNEEFLTLFTTTRFSQLSDLDVFRATYERFSVETKSKYEKTSIERMVRDMLTEIIGNMRRDIMKADVSKMYVSLQEPMEFNLRIRQKMIETLETAIKNKTQMTYYFDDMKPKGR